MSPVSMFGYGLAASDIAESAIVREYEPGPAQNFTVSYADDAGADSPSDGQGIVEVLQSQADDQATSAPEYTPSNGLEIFWGAGDFDPFMLPDPFAGDPSTPLALALGLGTVPEMAPVDLMSIPPGILGSAGGPAQEAPPNGVTSGLQPLLDPSLLAAPGAPSVSPTATSTGAPASTAPFVQPSLDNRPAGPVMPFVANVGQADASARFTSEGFGYSLAISPTTLALDLPGHNPGDPATRLTMSFPGGNPNAALTGIHELNSKSNFCPPSRNVPHFSSVNS